MVVITASLPAARRRCRDLGRAKPIVRGRDVQWRSRFDLKQNHLYVDAPSDFRFADRAQADTLERKGEQIWTGDQPLVTMNPGICKPHDLRQLAADGRLNDEFINLVPVLGECKNTGGFLLPTFVMRHIVDAGFKRLDLWTAKIPKQSKRWVFGVHESNHWSAVRVGWKERVIQHYDPMHQKPSARRILKVSTAVGPA